MPTPVSLLTHTRHQRPCVPTASRPRRWLVRALMCASLLGSTGAAHANDWNSFGLDLARTRAASERSGPSFAPTGWTHTLPEAREAFYRQIIASPAVADGFVVVGTGMNLVRALRETDGKPLWTADTEAPVFASPVIHNGRVFVINSGGTVFALRLSDGALIWRQDLKSLVSASPAVADGALFVATGHLHPRILRLDLDDGRVVWETPIDLLQQSAYAPLAIGDGVLVAGETDGTYSAFSLGDGARRWTAKVPGSVNLAAPVIIGDGVLLFPGGPDAKVHKLLLASGQAAPGWPLALPAFAAEEIHGSLMLREHITSSLSSADGLLAFARRLDERFDDDGDGVADRFISREQVLVVDPAAEPRLLATIPNGRLESTDGHAIPVYGLCPTPAGYRSAAGKALLVVASSLQASVRVLDGTPDAAGNELWKGTLLAPTRSSPVFANARLVVATDSGQIQSFASMVNAPPAPPLLGLAPAGGRPADAASLVVRWGAAIDPQGDQPRYLVRVDDDGEILHDWDVEVLTTPGQQSVALAGRLLPGHVYTFAVRAQDAAGAWSPWSYSESFRPVVLPSVRLGESPVASLAEATGRAQAGDTITLGVGTQPLSETLVLPAGVKLVGAGPHLTTLDGTGLAIALAPAADSALSQLRVAGAQIGVKVEGATDVQLRNVILSDNLTAGLAVEPSGSARLINATVARNGIGVRVRGLTAIRNTFATLNGVGISAADAALITSGYNDVFGNQGADWETARPDATDLRETVSFDTAADLYLLPKTAQPSTDRGDPADEWSAEPAPNGARINIGAYGNTAFAELSAGTIPPAPPADGGAAADGATSGGGSGADGGLISDAGTATPENDAGPATPAPVSSGDCACAVGGTGQGPPAWLLIFAALAAARGLRRRR